MTVLVGVRAARDHREQVRERIVEGLAVGVAAFARREPDSDLLECVDQAFGRQRAARRAGLAAEKRVVGQPEDVARDLARDRGREPRSPPA